MKRLLPAAWLVAAALAACGGSPSPAPAAAATPSLPDPDEARVTVILPWGGAGAWAGAFDGTLALLGAAVVRMDPPESPAWGSVRALVENAGDLVVAAGRGLFRLGADGWEDLGSPGDASLPVSLTAGYGGLWVGRADPATGLGSLARVGGGVWALHDHTAAIASASMVAEIIADTDGAIWVATNAAGVARRSAAGSWYLYDLSSGAVRSDRILDLAADPLGGVWVATAHGVGRITPAGHEAAPGSVAPGPLAVTGDAVWVGGPGGAISLLERAEGTWREVRAAGPEQAAVTQIVAAADGTAWAGTAGDGVLRFASDGTPLPGFTPADGHVTALAAADDMVWAGTRGGRAYRLIGTPAGVDAQEFRVVENVAPPREGRAGRVSVPAGWFLMGSDTDRPDEAPRHRVYVDAFAIDRYEVTNGRYAEFVAAAHVPPAASWPGGSYELGRADHPVVGLRWQEAADYCAWAGGRLPTEAEWEKAARGADGRTWPWGDHWGPARAVTAASGSPGPQHVGSLPDGASPYDALDMAGNVEEWVADYYQADYYQAAPDRNPAGPTTVMNHVRRGGSWAGDADQARSSYRTSSHGSSPDFRAGFRCAWDG